MAEQGVDELLCAMVDFMAFGPLPTDTHTAGGAHTQTHTSRYTETHTETQELSADVRHISAACAGLSGAWAGRAAREEALRARLDAALLGLEVRSKTLEDTRVLESYRRLCSLEAKRQLLLLHAALEALRRCSPDPDPNTDINITEVVALVADIVSCAPSALPTESHIFKLLSETTHAFCGKILSSFQVDFEEHLRQSSDAVHSHKLWIQFLADAKSPVAAYILLSILPVTFSATGNVVEAYEESLDRVLLPMWSRFHFHLVTAREEGTMRQLLWTFQYAKNLVDTLSVFATDVMSDSFVCQLLRKSGHVVSTNFILRKVSRFMRAHVAVFIEVLSQPPHSLSRGAVLHIMESALEFDSILEQKGLEDLYVSEVVCEFKPALKLWLTADTEFVLKRLQSACPRGRDNAEAFGLRFVRPFTSDAKVIGRAVSTEVNCFKCVYEASWLLLHVCRRRYAYVPMQCEDAVVAAVIEPILCAALGLLLYRIRSQPVLVSLSKQALPNEVVSYNMEQTLMLPVSEVLESARYFMDVLGTLTAVESFSRLKCNMSRFEERWKRMRTKLSAASMFSSSRSGAISVECAGHIVAFAFSGEDSEISAKQSSMPPQRASGAATGPTKLVQTSLKDVLMFVDNQASLLCRGLTEWHEELLLVYKLQRAPSSSS
jgi:hypothetical protein